MRYTIAEVAEKLELEREVARGLVKLLLHLELATDMGTRPHESGRGRAEAVYHFNQDFEQHVAEFLRRGELSL